ncbi:hypothetical protein H072_5129 [Dactylellina haptotyla CBS 200.50]|uniref:Ryanodine receptor Ryr domain-containing protein n=1 Tax=Dactylellina haptotyla (strain CBS 200.50) TaxID=1284197 RepID=S8BNG1_DACHA|nr:hypothetical protein H072_5129 [Dactylellina haptotyla CBS 200.50]
MSPSATAPSDLPKVNPGGQLQAESAPPSHSSLPASSANNNSSTYTPNHDINSTPPLDPSIREAVSEELYKRYKQSRRDMAEKDETEKAKLKEKDASLQDGWDQLSDHLKASTRAQADDIPRKLRMIGYYMAKDADAKTNGHILETFSEAELEFLGEVEHDRWAAERMKSGWTSSEQRNSTTQQTPFFVPYSQLEQKWKDVDKDMVKGVPEILKKSGYRIYKREENTKL